jgi:hypothetical protein
MFCVKDFYFHKAVLINAQQSDNSTSPANGINSATQEKLNSGHALWFIKIKNPKTFCFWSGEKIYCLCNRFSGFSSHQ